MFLFWVFYDFFFFLCNLTNRWLSELCISGITSTSLVWLAITRPQSCQSCFRLCIRARNIGTSKKTIFSQPLLYLFLESLLKFPPSFNPVQNHLGWKLAVKLWQVDVVQLYFNFFFPFIFCLYPICWKTLGRNQFYLKHHLKVWNTTGISNSLKGKKSKKEFFFILIKGFKLAVLKIDNKIKLKCTFKVREIVFAGGWHYVKVFRIKNQRNWLFWRRTIYSGLVYISIQCSQCSE